MPSMVGEEFADGGWLEAWFDCVERMGVPIVIHPNDVAYADAFPGYDGAIFMTVGRLFDSSLSVLRLILSGVMERHPNLKVLQTHAGALLPYQAGRLNKNARHIKLSEQPSDYLKRLFVDTVTPQELTVRTAVEFFGVDRVLYGTDYPCWKPATAFEVITAAGLPAQTKSQVLGGNAMKLFNLS
jgi:aminocarboxymuconate-semialdehyde decarboxylase